MEQSRQKFRNGKLSGTTIPTGQKGFIPNSDYYNYCYPTNVGATIPLSNSIGQGEVLTTPIQLANMVATIANRDFQTPFC